MSDDPQEMMNLAKRDIVIAFLKSKDGKATFEELFNEADRHHCDVLTAALLSLKRAKVVGYDGMMLLMPTHKNVVVTLLKPDFDPFAPN